ncbi:MAG: hypothetical protein ACOCSE_01455 [Chitinivibrionales bacterium]
MTKKEIEETVAGIDSLPKDESQEAIERTAQRLEKLSYEPILLTDASGFLRYTKEDLKQVCKGIINDKSDDESVKQQIDLLIYHYRLLQRLRTDEPEAWDEVEELVGDD